MSNPFPEIEDYDDFAFYPDLVNIESEEQLKQELKSKGFKVLSFGLVLGECFERDNDVDAYAFLIMVSGRMVVACAVLGIINLDPGDALTIPSYHGFVATSQEKCRFFSCWL